MNSRRVVKLVILFVLLGIYTFSYSQENKTAIKKEEKKYVNWHNCDPGKDKIAGISIDKAYSELLKDKKFSQVIVAVIDGGVDINHEDLKNRIWINTDEIPGNGIDDDNNGFIDDIHGWNFIGNAEGKNLNRENLEITRIYRDYSKLFEGKDTTLLTKDEQIKYQEYKKIKKTYLKKYDEAKNRYESFLPLKTSYYYCDSLMQVLIGKKDYTPKELKKVKTNGNENLDEIKKFLLKLNKKGYTRSEIDEYSKYLDSKYLYHFNTEFQPRKIVGDDIWTNSGQIYGNNDIIGPDPGHGTFVSGIIAGERNNGIGVNGIADSVKIMVLRAIPDGDEYDKDVANAITYAVNNGAQIINCSFGKNYSPQKHFVDQALKLAKEKGVLIIHAAGNDAENNDSVMHYPINKDSAGTVITDNWIEVGASSRIANDKLAASFSDYGKETVDLFAPGYRVYSTQPGNKYDLSDGTSFSAPMVCGAATLLKSVYPSLTASQIKEILLKSGVTYPNLQVYLPMDDDNKQKPKKVSFSSLSNTGSVLNVYNAIKLAEQYSIK